MNLSRVIIGPVVTEKAERQKELRAYTVKVNPRATKVDISAALKKHFNVEPVSVRVLPVRQKSRLAGAGKSIVKRSPHKRAVVTLSSESKPLDLTRFTA